MVGQWETLQINHSEDGNMNLTIQIMVLHSFLALNIRVEERQQKYPHRSDNSVFRKSCSQYLLTGFGISLVLAAFFTIHLHKFFKQFALCGLFCCLLEGIVPGHSQVRYRKIKRSLNEIKEMHGLLPAKRIEPWPCRSPAAVGRVFGSLSSFTTDIL